MIRKVLPSRAAVTALGALGVVVSAVDLTTALRGIQSVSSGKLALALLGASVLLFVIDVGVTWWLLRRHPVSFERHLPNALALGQPTTLRVTLAHEGARTWHLALFDHVPGTMRLRALPARVVLPPARQLDVQYEITPTRRGLAAFEPAELRARSWLGLANLQWRVGAPQSLPVYPNFAALSRYAWLAGTHRLLEIGIKTYAAHGAGTDFKQLGDYFSGMPTRHIDWKASLRHRRPVVREFQDDRDQSVMFLLDCGRRMRSDGAVEGSHFDQALNAAMLLAYVALKDGDAVGAMTFASEPSQQRHVAPAKGNAALNMLVARLHDVEPSAAHSDYLGAARDLMLRLPRRSLVVVLTNFRDEDCHELEAALKLMRSRHLVLLASLREQALAHLAAQPLPDAQSIVEVASAHWFERSRAEAFRRLAGRDQFLIDVPPRELAAALVNRYHAVKRARLL